MDLDGSQPRDFTNVGTNIYFSAKADMGAVLTDVGRELFIINTGISHHLPVKLVRDIATGADSSPSMFEPMQGKCISLRMMESRAWNLEERWD